jgi:hypothetical protein
MAGFGEGLGSFIGAELGAQDLRQGLDNVSSTAGGFNATTAPYNSFGQSFISPASGAITKIGERAGTVKGYDDFMAGYEESPGAKYVKGQALEAQNESAAARGNLLSGTNMRALGTIDAGISNTFANQAYDQYLKGDSQQFGQLETALGNMFQAIGVGTTATGQQAGVAQSQMAQQAAIAKAQAENDKGKGSGLGSMFGGLGSLATMF